jgi:hypothetical protein
VNFYQTIRLSYENIGLFEGAGKIKNAIFFFPFKIRAHSLSKASPLSQPARPMFHCAAPPPAPICRRVVPSAAQLSPQADTFSRKMWLVFFLRPDWIYIRPVWELLLNLVTITAGPSQQPPVSLLYKPLKNPSPFLCVILGSVSSYCVYSITYGIIQGDSFVADTELIIIKVEIKLELLVKHN